jgi:hypothetical protein
LLTALGVCRYDPSTKSLTTIGKGNGLYTEVISISYTDKKIFISTQLIITIK